MDSQSLRPLLREKHNKALVLGTGGAAKAVHYALEKLGINPTSVSRSGGGSNTLTYSDLDRKIILDHCLIINTTPLGTYPGIEMFPDIPYEHLSEYHLLYDLVYNPPVTRFLELGKTHGAEVKNGLEMLELQALRSYSVWNSPLD